MATRAHFGSKSKNDFDGDIIILLVQFSNLEK